MYEKTFEELKIGDSFETATGIWTVWDKGERSLIAFKNENPEEHIIFYTYDFPNT